MSESESIDLVEVLSNIPEETFKEWRREVMEQLSKPNPHATRYDPRFPLEDQSYAARDDFFYRLKCKKAEQEYFDLLKKEKEHFDLLRREKEELLRKEKDYED